MRVLKVLWTDVGLSAFTVCECTITRHRSQPTGQVGSRVRSYIFRVWFFVSQSINRNKFIYSAIHMLQGNERPYTPRKAGPLRRSVPSCENTWTKSTGRPSRPCTGSRVSLISALRTWTSYHRRNATMSSSSVNWSTIWMAGLQNAYWDYFIVRSKAISYAAFCLI